MVLKMIVEANIGAMDIRVFTCSTCFVVHSVHVVSFVVVWSWLLMHALSRNL